MGQLSDPDPSDGQANDASRPRVDGSGTTAGTSPETTAGDKAPQHALHSVDLETLLVRRRARRIRGVQQAGVGLALALLVVGAITTYGGGWSPFLEVLGLAHAPTATPAHPNGGAVAIVSNVSFGTVTFNGRQLRDTVPVVVPLQRGTSTVTLSAAPFRPVTCTFGLSDTGSLSELPGSGGSCAGVIVFGSSRIIRGKMVDSGIIILLDGSDLPADQLAGANDAIWQVLSVLTARVAVPAGDYIAAGRGPDGALHVQRASEPLWATYSFSRQSAALGSCPPLDGCIFPFPPPLLGPSDTRVWRVAVPAAPDLRFTTASGAAAGGVNWQGHLQTGHVGSGLTFVLADDPSASWQVVDSAPFLEGSVMPMPPPTLAQQLDASICALGVGALHDALGAQADSYGYGSRAQDGAGGCADFLQSFAGAPKGVFLWRFGVLLAADAAAHTLLPALPMAPPDEIAAVGV